MKSRNHTANLLPDALWIQLHGQDIGICLKCSDGRNKLVFSPDYIHQPVSGRMTLTLGQLQDPDCLLQTRGHHQRLEPVLSNLLPEGVLRDWYVHHLKIHAQDEFALLAMTGRNLAGAVTAVPQDAPLPDWRSLQGIDIRYIPIVEQEDDAHFSLSGIQMKFSGKLQDGRYRIGNDFDGEQWILKTPSTVHPHVTANEYSAMKLAESAGVEIPEIRLIPLSSLDNLPVLQLPDETDVYAIRRFDRGPAGKKIHTEDFAQVFNLYPHEKYSRANYEQIGRILLRFSTAGIADVCAMAQRLLVNILLANGVMRISRTGA